MKTYKKVKISQDKVNKVYCDRCRKLITEKGSLGDFCRGGEMHMDAGYGSKYDGLNCTLDLCDDCIDLFLKLFSERKMDDKENDRKTSDDYDEGVCGAWDYIQENYNLSKKEK